MRFIPNHCISIVDSKYFLVISSLSNGEGNDTPLQYPCLENPRDGGAWWAAFYGVAQSRTWLKLLSSSSSSSSSSLSKCSEVLIYGSSKTRSSKKTFCKHLYVKIPLKYCWGVVVVAKPPLWTLHCIYALVDDWGKQGKKEVQRALSLSVYSGARLSTVFFMFVHLISLCCVYSLYKEQVSPNLHLVFLDVKEIASVPQK